MDGINVTYHVHGVERLKTEMFDAWLKSSPSASWSDLISALKSMNEHRAALAACGQLDLNLRCRPVLLVHIRMVLLILVQQLASSW